MAESKYDDGYSSDQEEKQLVLGEEDDENGDSGLEHHHTLNLACSIAVKSEVLCVAFSYDGRYLLACCGDGLARVFNPVTGVGISVLSPKRARSSTSRGGDGGESKGGDGGGDTARGRSSKNRSASILENIALPCTCAAFRPHAKIREKTSGVALIGNSHGEIQLWHVPSAKLLHQRGLLDKGAHSNSQDEGKGDDLDEDFHHRVSTPFGVEVLCCAYSGDGQLFAVGASDGVVRVYSDSTKELVVELKPGLAKGAGHSSRIFSVKFHPDDPNVIVSGGWDNCVHVWDVGKASTTRTVFGPHICGDAVDVAGEMIVTGSWRDDSQLETWHLDSGEALGSPFWSGLGEGVLLKQGLGRKCRLYAAAFGGPEGSKGKFIAAGGGEGANEVKVFDVSNNKTLVGSLLGLSAGAISLAFGPKGDRLAVGLADGKIHLMDIEASAGSAQGSVGGLNIMGF